VPSTPLRLPPSSIHSHFPLSLRSAFPHAHIFMFADYELGRLFACQGRINEAREQFELVLSGKHLEVGPSGRKGKYSLEVRMLPFFVFLGCTPTLTIADF
jgi:hypothetical protein